jgi:hypothetical protein
MELLNALLLSMNNLKIKNQKSGETLALFEKDSCLSVSQSVSVCVCVCEIVKLSGFERPQKN